MHYVCSAMREGEFLARDSGDMFLHFLNLKLYNIAASH
jgi:hypothetical protein